MSTKFLRLTTQDRSPILINVAHISAVFEGRKGDTWYAIVHLKCGKAWNVLQTVDEVSHALKPYNA